jgi:hypothetical protein
LLMFGLLCSYHRVNFQRQLCDNLDDLHISFGGLITFVRLWGQLMNSTFR